MNKRLRRHSSRASSKRVLFVKIFIGSIGKMIQSKPKFRISLGSMPSESLEEPKNLLAAAQLKCF